MPYKKGKFLLALAVIFFYTAVKASLLLADSVVSASYILKTSVFGQGGGIFSSSNFSTYFSLGQGMSGELSSSEYTGGSGYIYTVIELVSGTEYDIRHVFARTLKAGEEIEASAWIDDADPYFYWTPPKVSPPEVIGGYSFSLDILPDDIIDTKDSFYQYLPKSLTSGKHAFYVKAQSLSSGLWGKEGFFDIWIDVTEPIISNAAPSSGQVINEEKPEISCYLYDYHSGIDKKSIEMRLGIGLLKKVNFSFDENTNMVSYKPSVGLQDGVVIAAVSAKDLVGNEKELSWNFTIDTKKPSGTILIDNNDAETYSQVVTLTLDGDPGTGGTPITNVMISNDGIFDTESWQGYAGELEWIMPSVSGLRTVWVKFRDEAGNVSMPAYDSIELIIFYPETYILSGPIGITAETKAEFIFGASKSEAVFSYQFDGEDWTEFGAEDRVFLENLEMGNHYFKVKAAYDANQNGTLDPEEIDPTPSQRTWVITETGTLIFEKEMRPIKFWKWE